MIVLHRQKLLSICDNESVCGNDIPQWSESVQTVQIVFQFVATCKMFQFGLPQQGKKTIKLAETLWRGTQPAWVLTCEDLKVILTKSGLNIASISNVDDPKETSPLWIPKWPWASPHDCPHMRMNNEMEKIYGNREDSQLLANICGHNMCIDRFGLCKLTDEARTCHGEAPVVDWDVQSLSSETITFSTKLPLAKLFISRTFLFEEDRVYVGTKIVNIQSKYDEFFNVKLDDNTNLKQEESEKEKEKENEKDKETAKKIENVKNLQELTNILAYDIKKELFQGRAEMPNSYYSLNSSFLSLPKNRRRRKKLISKRENQNIERTYQIVHGMIEQELKEQFNFETFKLRKYSEIKEIKNKILAQMSHKMSENNKTSDLLNTTDLSNDPAAKDYYLNDTVVDEQGNYKLNDNDNTDDTGGNAWDDEQIKPRYDVEWCEHVTLGDPFLDGVDIETNCDQAWNFPTNMEKSRFSEEKGYKPLENLNINDTLAMPRLIDDSIKIEEATALRVNENEDWGIFVAKNKNLGFELEYTWETSTWPWMTLWTEHRARDLAPWNSRERTRGLEFTSKPFPIPDLEKELPQDRLIVDPNSGLVCFDGTPIQLAIPKEGLTSSFSFRWSPL